MTPSSKPKQIVIKHERVGYWLKNGAQPSDTVKWLLEKNPAAAAETQPAA